MLYCGVLSSRAASRKDMVPAAPAICHSQDKPERRSKYIRWSQLLRRVFGIETICQTCRAPLRLIALVKSEAVAKKILTAMHLSADVPELRPARAPPGQGRDAREAEDTIN